MSRFFMLGPCWNAIRVRTQPGRTLVRNHHVTLSSCPDWLPLELREYVVQRQAILPGPYFLL